MSIRLLPVLALLLAVAAGPWTGAAPVSAQALPAFGPMSDSTATADTTTVDGITPTGAFLRSVVLPGWGHAAIGSHLRGAFYVGAEGGIGWMLLRIRSRLRSANDRLDLIESDARSALEFQGIVDPEIQEDSLSRRDDVRSARGLVEARKQQREDWIALGIFFVLLSGADAYVSAHLKDFPAEPVFNANENGRVEVGFRVPVGGGGPGG